MSTTRWRSFRPSTADNSPITQWKRFGHELAWLPAIVGLKRPVVVAAGSFRAQEITYPAVAAPARRIRGVLKTEKYRKPKANWLVWVMCLASLRIRHLSLSLSLCVCVCIRVFYSSWTIFLLTVDDLFKGNQICVGLCFVLVGGGIFTGAMDILAHCGKYFKVKAND